MSGVHRDLHVLTHAFPTRRSSDLLMAASPRVSATCRWGLAAIILFGGGMVSACSSHREEPVSALPVSEFASAVRVIEFPTPVECVPYARQYSKIYLRGDRKSVASGKSVAVRVELGGRRNIKKKKY